MIFAYKKPVKVGVFNLPSDLPSFMYKDYVEVNENKFACPAVSSMNKRMYEINCTFDLEITFGEKNDDVYYKYEFPTNVYKDKPDVHKIINEKVSVIKSKNNAVTMQFVTEGVFVTDKKDLELIVLPPLDNMQLTNCRFVTGSFKPYSWLRNINASWVQIDKGKQSKIKLSMDKPMMTILFNYPVNLKEIQPTNKILNYHKYMYGIVDFRNKVTQIIPDIIKKRPKKLL